MVRPTESLERYKHLRRVGLELNNRLGATVDRSVLNEGGKRLGMLKRDTLVLETEDEIAVLIDFCLHDVRRHGATAIERYLSESPPAPGSDEWVLLQAKRRARYSLLVAESAEPGLGIHVRDQLRDEPLFLVDVGLGHTAAVNMVLAARIMAPEGIGMTTGAALPVGVLSPAEQSRYMHRLKTTFPGMDFGNLSPEESSDLTAHIIRTCLRRGAAERVRYVEPGRVQEALSSAQRIGRNDPCPCGSGKKFKHCCGSQR